MATRRNEGNQSLRNEENVDSLVRSLRPLVIFIIAGTLSLTAAAQTFTRTFTISSESSGLDVINQVGSIKVTTSGTNKIAISARRNDNRSQILASQNPEG